MTTYVGFPPANESLDAPGHPWGTRGVISGLRIEEIQSHTAAAVLKFQHLTRFTAAMADYYFLVHLDGLLADEALITQEAVLTGLRDDKPYAVDVLPASTVEHDLWTDPLTIYLMHDIGDRVYLSWAEVDLDTYPDFLKYRIKWDNATESGTPNVLLADVVGAQNTTYVTTALTEDTAYTFARSQLDRVGNESAQGSNLVKTIRQPPLAPDTVAAVYDEPTRKLTITFEHPAGQHADCVGYAIYANEMPSWGALLDGLCAETYMRRRLLEPQNGSWTSSELYAGDWLFAVKGVDRDGLESSYELISLSLAIDGSDLVEQPTRPAAPTWIEAQPQAAGVILVTVYHDGTNATAIVVYQDGVEVDSQAVVAAATSYTYTTGALVNGQEYAFTARAENDPTLSELSPEALAVADSVAPGGSNLLVGELVY